MRLARFLYNKKTFWGAIEDEDRITLLRKDPFEKIQLSRTKISLQNIHILAPATPTKVILAGLNYRDHARELGMKIPKEPIIFLKPPTSVIGFGSAIKYPKGMGRLDYEAELALIVKKQGRNIPLKKASSYILGYTCLNDVTARSLQKKDVQWTRAKSFDTFCPLGPWIETKVKPECLSIKSYLNGILKQNSSTSNFIFSVEKLVSFISSIMTILPGDIISTGTPPGVGALKVGDVIEVAIQHIGVLKNYVR